MKNQGSNRGFALPTILTASIVLIMILVTAVSATVAVRTSLRDQKFAQLAELAAEAGNAYATSCMQSNNNTATWSDETPLRPNTNCNGVIVSGMPAYTYEEETLRTYFVVPLPQGGNVAAKGYAEALRSSTGIAWRVWGADVAKAASGGGGASLPIGTSIDGHWTTAPEGFLLENGAAVSRTTYSDLFAVIGTRYGSGDGSTTFNLPDSRGRVNVNISNIAGDTEFDVLNDKGGAKTHTLSVAEMPSHTHVQNAHNHAPPVAVTYGGNAATYRSVFATNSGFWSSADWNNAVSSTVATNQNTGGGGAHNNLQPFITVTRAIKF